MSHTAFLSIGSNIGDALENCKKALNVIACKGEVRILNLSSFYKTEPWGDAQGDWFVNCAAKIETYLNAEELLRCLQRIEHSLEGKRHKKNQPRVIDIDILFFNNDIINKPVLKGTALKDFLIQGFDSGNDLVIPHPMLHKRGFVLLPLLEIEPFFIHPVLNRTIEELNLGLEDKKKVIRL